MTKRELIALMQYLPDDTKIFVWATTGQTLRIEGVGAYLPSDHADGVYFPPQIALATEPV